MRDVGLRFENWVKGSEFVEMHSTMWLQGHLTALAYRLVPYRFLCLLQPQHDIACQRPVSNANSPLPCSLWLCQAQGDTVTRSWGMCY